MPHDLRKVARACFDAGVEAADPYEAVSKALNNRPRPSSGRLIFVALGKAAVGMMRAALDWQTPDEAILVTNPENETKVAGVRCLLGDHPTPSPRGEISAAEVETVLDKASVGDHILLLLSGGASALVPAPKPPVTLKDKVFLNDSMIAGGVPIEEINIVRRAMSRLKGGGFLAAALPAHVETLILSDVPSDDIRFIASGPTVPRDPQEDALAILKKYNLLDPFMERIQTTLAQPVTMVPTKAHNLIVGGNAQSVRAMSSAVPEGFAYELRLEPLQSDVKDVADYFVKRAQSACANPIVYLSGGEPTVNLSGSGRGGRNQELALRIALGLEGVERSWAFLSAGTDGIDGPTDAAGAIVDNATQERVRAAGFSLEDELENNNSYPVLSASGDLLITGSTGTNVGDLHVLLLA
ncbi:MAG: DUF4147 domain-containing protein [Pseudomonadota bacterium]